MDNSQERRTVDKQAIEKAVREILIAIGEDPDREGLVGTPDRVARMYEEIFSGLHEDPRKHLKVLFKNENHEEMVVMLLNAKHEIIGSRLISRGALTSSTVDPREVFSYAISKHACFVIVAHNHPSGCSQPSPEDEVFTAILEAAGKILGIYLLDSIIIGRGEYFSFEEDGRLDSKQD